MIFSTMIFVTVFLPLVLSACWGLALLLRRLHLRPWPAVNALLLGASLLFYFWGEGFGVLWLCASIAVNWGAARLVARSEKPAVKKFWLWTGIVANLAFLGYFKYAGFGVRCLNVLSGAGFTIPRIALPLGISFYTFQAMSYVIDVYRGEVKLSRGVLDFACYITMFPQLVAGPIVRYIDIEKQLVVRETPLARIASGMRRFLCGLVKKAVIANTVAAFADGAWEYFDAGKGLSVDLAWLAVVAYALQIYYDFSGYSDMAIGIGRMLGFDFPENFRHPYCSTSVREFWRRWHISLSTWFRDYLYIPLGGNRRGLPRTCLNSMIVFALCGLWHGASSMFVIWGLWHGLFLTVERLLFPRAKEAGARRRGLRAAFARFAGWLYTVAVFLSGWVLFRSTTRFSAATVFKSLFGMVSPERDTALLYIDAAPKFLAAVVLGVIFAFPVVPAAKAFFARRNATVSAVANLFTWFVVTVCALFAILLIAGGSYNPFIYFRF